MSGRGHLPMRVCLGCGTVDRQTAMLRIVRKGVAGLAIDAERVAGGRGGYLHQRPDCWNQFARRKGAVRSLRMTVDRAVRAELVAQLEHRIEGEG